MTLQSPQTAADLGLTMGALAPPERRVTFWNWEDPPFLRWSFQHVTSFVPTARIWRGEGPASVLEPAPQDLDAITIATRSFGEISLPDLLHRTFTDGFLVLHEGRVVSERYFNGMQPWTRHLLMSVSKSIIGTLAGVVIGRGQLAEHDLIVDVLGELRGSSFEGATVRDVLDMRTGTRFSEDYDDPASDANRLDGIMDWGPRSPDEPLLGLCEYIPTLENSRPHGGAFEYRSILTDLLGWILERAAGVALPELLSEALWAPLGPEEDSEVTVDHFGGVWVDGGICATLRDLGRFGQMHLAGGHFNGRQIVPATWIRDTRQGAADSREAFAGCAAAERYPSGFYRNQWWVVHPQPGVYQASGIHGQFVSINVPAAVVVAKFSTLPVALDNDLWLDHVALFDAVAAALD